LTLELMQFFLSVTNANTNKSYTTEKKRTRENVVS